MSSAAEEIFAVALFRYATDGTAGPHYHEADLLRPFRSRRG